MVIRLKCLTNGLTLGCVEGIKMKKLLALVASLLLVASFATPAQSAGAKYKVYQKTLATFSSTATALTSQQKAQVKAAVEANPDAEKFICTGIRYYLQPMSVNIMVRKRAKAACDYAKQLNPALSTWYQNKPTQARSYAGKVLLTVKTAYSQAEIVLDSAVQQVAARMASASYGGETINSHKSPNYPQALVDLTIKATERGVAYLADEYEFTGADFVFFTKEDASWAQDIWDELVAGTNLASVKVYSEDFPYPCRSAEYTYQKNGATKYITYMCQDGNEFLDVSFMAHGATHWFQGNFKSHEMPNWLNEGSATFYGEVIGWLPNESNAKMVKWNGDYILHDALLSGEEAVRRKIEAIEVKNPPSTGDGYTLGRMLYTALVGLHGEDKAIELMKTFGTSSDFEANFLKVYGFSKDAFYDEAIPLIQEWAERDWGKKYPGELFTD